MEKSSKFQLPPKPQTEANDEATKSASEKKIQEFINKGGGSAKMDHDQAHEESKLKKLTIRLLEAQHEEINKLRRLRPKEPRRRIGISIENWVIEAIEEKLQKERKRYL